MQDAGQKRTYLAHQPDGLGPHQKESTAHRAENRCEAYSSVGEEIGGEVVDETLSPQAQDPAAFHWIPPKEGEKEPLSFFIEKGSGKIAFISFTSRTKEEAFEEMSHSCAEQEKGKARQALQREA